MHGQGKYTDQYDATYEGGFDKGKAHGRGVLTLSDGHTCDAQWVNGECLGTGTVTRPNGEEIQLENWTGKRQKNEQLGKKHKQGIKRFKDYKITPPRV
jgi:hypothetical protein